MKSVSYTGLLAIESVGVALTLNRELDIADLMARYRVRVRRNTGGKRPALPLKLIVVRPP